MSARRLQLDDGASWHDPRGLGELRYRIRWHEQPLRPDEREEIISALETLEHILLHPAGTEAIIAQLRQARRILKEVQR